MEQQGANYKPSRVEIAIANVKTGFLELAKRYVAYTKLINAPYLLEDANLDRSILLLLQSL